MKTIYSFILCLLSFPVFSQECDSLFSPCVGTFSRNGFYFDLEALNDVTVSSFSYMAQNTGTRDISVYYRQGTYFGYEGVAASWTLLGTQTSITPVTGLSCPLPVNALDITFSLCILQGQTYGFYMVMSSGTGTLESHNTLPESSIGAQDSNLKLITGKGQFGIGDFSGTLLGGLTFQGGIQYDCGCVTSSNEITEDNISIFPNPASNEFRIKNAELRIEKIEIYNLLGEKVYSHQPVTRNQKLVTISVADLPPGIYFAHAFLDDGNIKHLKFIKE